MSFKGLSEKERRILARYEFHPDRSAAEVASETGYKSTTVSYVMRQLAQRGVIEKTSYIDATLLGYLDVAVYFSLIDLGAEKKQQLIDDIIAHERVIHFGALLGDYQYKMVILAKTFEEIAQIMCGIFRGHGDVFSDKIVAPRITVFHFRRNYLDPSYQEPSARNIIGSKCALVELDEIDHQILSGIGAYPFESMRKLAKNLEMPYSKVERRIRSLRETNVIPGFFYRVDTRRIGMQSFRLLVQRKGFCQGTRQRLLDFCEQSPWVVCLVESFGSWDYEIIVEVPSNDAITPFVEELHGVCGMRISSVRVLMNVKNYKLNYYPLSVCPDALNRTWAA